MVNSQELKHELKAASDELGSKMDETIDFKPSRILYRVGWSLTSEIALIPRDDTEGAFTRTWLERVATKDRKTSSIKLYTDIVSPDPVYDGRPDLFGRDLTVAAVFDARDQSLEVQQAPGATDEEKLRRIQELGEFVTAIELAEIHKQVRNAAIVHPI